MDNNRAEELSNRLTELFNEYPEVDNYFLGIKSSDQLVVITDDCPVCFKDAITNWVIDRNISHVRTKPRIGQC